MKSNKLVYLVFLPLFLSSCGIQPNNQMDISDMEFRELIQGEIGTGLELISDINRIDFSEENWFGFFVANSSNESIEFTNILFSCVVFQYDEKNARWEELTLKVVPAPRTIILPTGDQFSNLPINTFSLNTDDLDLPANRTFLRFYISGKGVDTSKIYGAYVDVPVLLP
jgi:hypothetical protein